MSIRIGILGYGNLGKGVEKAVIANADQELARIFTRRNPAEVKTVSGAGKVFHADDLLKMKDRIDPKEVLQAAKYCPYLEIMFGPEYEVIPVLVLTAAHDYFNFAQIGNSDAILPVCSGDMLFNVFDEYMGFLEQNV